MNNITRRSFIEKTLLALASTAVSSTTYAKQPPEVPLLGDNSKFQRECVIIYHEWEKKEKINPATFLSDSIKNNVSSKLKISELTKIDFQNQNFFSVDGLLLGKTEAAFLALLGSGINH
jgi:hypothetical protein